MRKSSVHWCQYDALWIKVCTKEQQLVLTVRDIASVILMLPMMDKVYKSIRFNR